MSQSNAENPPEYDEIPEHDYTLEEVQDIEELEAEKWLDMMEL